MFGPNNFDILGEMFVAINFARVGPYPKNADLESAEQLRQSANVNKNPFGRQNGQSECSNPEYPIEKRHVGYPKMSFHLCLITSFYFQKLQERFMVSMEEVSVEV